ncbi:MAG: hypothetical protein ACD_11C00026G0014 [uncultured bacterium]|nr:MAG: hypothetical protein ACD_11C00026G0014 [uncultured bacterium]HBR72058.1 protein-L-isoaspartate O-methyltransferase [Candidatus Moranbacteria bacterium]
MSRLTNDLMRRGYLKTDIVIDAFSVVGREEFVPDDLVESAEKDIPLPIGYGQTISQPMTVAIMLELLDVKSGQNILDVGSGSGWTTTMLAYIVGEKGKVTSIERIQELCDFGKNNFFKFDFSKNRNTEFHCADGSKGYAKNAPYDRILVSAMSKNVPQDLKNQLAIGGKIVIPVHNSIWYLEKRGENDFYKEEFSGFSFVPLIEKNNF